MKIKGGNNNELKNWSHEILRFNWIKHSIRPFWLEKSKKRIV